MALWVVDIQPAKRLALDGEAIVDVIREMGHEIVETIYDPTSGRFPYDLEAVFAVARPVILRGSVGFAAWAYAQWSITPGAFRSELLRPSSYLPAYGALALNADAIITTYAEFQAQRAEFEERLGGTLFVKPADGGKLLSGTLLEPGRSLFDAHYSSHRRWSEIPEDFRLLLTRTHTISTEWRFVIAGERVVASSLYKRGEVLESRRGAPEGATAVAEKVAKHVWRPVNVFIADVAETENGFRLLELNTFGTAGLYDCDLNAIVQAVSEYAH
ncbi:MAG: hypothetical protein JWL77_3379 [Chthonomonadaceae bacterium]|nr:hypothetical protein [Chthonomonadaceae bacterium]